LLLSDPVVVVSRRQVPLGSSGVTVAERSRDVGSGLECFETLDGSVENSREVSSRRNLSLLGDSNGVGLEVGQKVGRFCSKTEVSARMFLYRPTILSLTVHVDPDSRDVDSRLGAEELDHLIDPPSPCRFFRVIGESTASGPNDSLVGFVGTLGGLSTKRWNKLAKS
jgi:hypothetical protein